MVLFYICLHVDKSLDSVSVPGSVSASLGLRSGNEIIEGLHSGNKVMQGHRFGTQVPQGLHSGNYDPQRLRCVLRK